MTDAMINDHKPANRAGVDIAVLHEPWEYVPFNTNAIANRIVSETLARAELPPSVHQKQIEISIALVNDAAIRQLNKEFRNKDKPTNVLSFESEQTNTPENAEHPIGDIILSYETIEREAEEQNKTFQDHYSHLVLHGLLHLLGYDHIDDGDAEIMEAKEIEILRVIGVENPYL